MNNSLKHIQTLSEDLKQVAKVHEWQNSELVIQKKKLQEITAKYERLMEKINQTTEETELLDKKILMTKMTNFELKENNKGLEMRIENHLKNIHQKNRELNEAKLKYEREKIKLMQEQHKMDEYAEIVNKCIEQQEIFAEFQSQNELLRKLTEEKNNIFNELNLPVTIDVLEISNKVNEEMQDLTNSNESLKNEIDRKENKLFELEREETRVRQEIVMIEKRNAARLLRLKCQLREAESRLKNTNQ